MLLAGIVQRFLSVNSYPRSGLLLHRALTERPSRPRLLFDISGRFSAMDSPTKERSEFKGMELKCAVQNYHWGKVGTTSEVARLAKENSNMKIKRGECYAELWMGTHPNGPSIIAETGESLLSYIESNPEFLGRSSPQFKNNLPFLMKVLSVNKPLSIQVHPTKDSAVQLNKKNPEVYKDANHKPELALALTPFEALVGFRPKRELDRYFQFISDMSELIGVDPIGEFLAADDPMPALKKCFTGLMRAKPEAVKAALKSLMRQLNHADEENRDEMLADLVERLHKEYPGDVGVFCLYFMNYLQLEPGEAIYLPANEPHAYLSGDCIECMACSDNVVRAGLTPKPKDVETLCEMLNYECKPAESKIFKPIREDQYTLIYSPPIPDFVLAQIRIPSGIVAYELKVRDTASILLVTEGKAEVGSFCLKRGTVMFVPADQEVSLSAVDGITMYQAFSNP